jgi:hypothetical protein
MREHESDREREIRYMNELLQELRVILPGVQVLFAFLLIVVFSEGFSEVSPLQRDVYFAALVFTALSTACLIAPTTQHRILWRQGARSERLKIANRLTIIGTAFLAAGMGCTIFLITSFIYGTAWAVGVSVALVAVFVGLWFLLPFYRRQLGR